METKNFNEHTPANSTFPVQDQFNQVHMFTGLTKLEWMAGCVASSINVNDYPKWELYANACVDHARAILAECDKHKPEVKSPLTKI